MTFAVDWAIKKFFLSISICLRGYWDWPVMILLSPASITCDSSTWRSCWRLTCHFCPQSLNPWSRNSAGRLMSTWGKGTLGDFATAQTCFHCINQSQEIGKCFAISSSGGTTFLLHTQLFFFYYCFNPKIYFENFSDRQPFLSLCVRLSVCVSVSHQQFLRNY